MTRKHKPLTCTVSRDGVLRIEIGVDALAHACLRAGFLWDESCKRPDERYAISDARAFAVDVQRAVLDEAEDGSSLLTNMLDAACQEAVDMGSEYFVEKASES
jgi:hypothetical protein